ncbi:S8 family peptidase [Reichenbachiella sp.]|uniref:S8 family peptidase n=1 Tax=Reichenbachiella sp. TaxID=2184521 RepID=UPI003BAF5B64
MNLTFFYRGFWLTVFSLCLVDCSIYAQSVGLPELPNRLKSLVVEQAQSRYRSVTEFLVPTSLVVKNESLQILRKLDGWAVVRSEGSDSKLSLIPHYKVNKLWKLSHLDLLNSKESQLITIKYDNEEVLKLLSPSKIVYHSYPFLKTYAQPNEVERLLNHSGVLYIGKESNEAILESRVLDLNLIPNNVLKVHKRYPSLNGSPVAIGLKEELFDLDDFDILDRVFTSEWASENTNNHATEMATIIGGAGVSFVDGRGVADEVEMFSSNFDVQMPDVNQFYIDHQLLVQNHSYGGGVESFYGASAEAYDRLSNEIPELLHVMSSGNSGEEAPSAGTYAGLVGWANLTGNYKNAKNNLVIGAVDTTGVVLPFSSVGPASDGRVKPELVAYSTTGTSNATALTSGVAALIQDAYLVEYLEPAPSALVKALLINGASDVGVEGLDFRTGYGNMDAYASLKMLDNEQLFLESIEKGNSKLMAIEVPAQTTNIKITLVWNDPAGQANDLNPLVNDLNLSLLDPDGKTWLPWVLDNTANTSALEAPAVRNKDHLNNVEQISLEFPTAGTYEIMVDGMNLFTDKQDFSVVYSFEETNLLEWEYPLEHSFMPYDGETGSYFRWNSTFDTAEGELYLSIDDGKSWELLTSTLDLDKGHYRWSPENMNSRARAKIRIGGQEFESENFVISNTLQMNPGFTCEDSVMLHWSAQPNISEYEILQFDGHAFQVFKTTVDTMVVIEGKDSKEKHFKVIPKFQTGEEAIGSYLVSTDQLTSDCYLTSFFGFKNEDGILLNTSLSSLHEVSSVNLETSVDNEFQPLHSFNLENRSLLEYLDTEPEEGLNLYRSLITFENGEIIISDTLKLIYLNQMTALLYPNPVPYGSSLAIQTNQSGEQKSILRIFDLKGEEHSVMELSEQEYMNIGANLIPGMYLYSVENEKGSTTGRLIVR